MGRWYVDGSIPILEFAFITINFVVSFFVLTIFDMLLKGAGTSQTLEAVLALVG